MVLALAFSNTYAARLPGLPSPSPGTSKFAWRRDRVASIVRGLRSWAGAVDFLTKPVRDQTLLDAVAAGIARDTAQRVSARIVRQHAERLATLTPREHQVLREVVRGQLNKQIAFDLGISEITVKLHRSNVMRKMHATSVGSLIRAWEALPHEAREQRPD